MSLYTFDDDGSLKVDAATDRVDEFVKFVDTLKDEELDTTEHRQLAVLLDETFHGRPIDEYVADIKGSDWRLNRIGSRAHNLSQTIADSDPVYDSAFKPDIDEIIEALIDA